MNFGKHVYFVGIGGFGMSAIARIMRQQGYTVSGSDRAENDLTRALSALGVRVFIGHDASNISADVSALVVTSAVDETHVEIATARARGLPVYKRSQMIDALMQGKDCLAVAGTHGKTTTTAMLAYVLRQAGAAPSYIVGGVLANTGDNAAHGAGSAFVVEADEYDNMYHGLRPALAIFTSAEYDHPDFFKSEADMHASFAHFLSLVQGKIIAYADDNGVLALTHACPNVVYYGWRTVAARWQASTPTYDAHGMAFAVYRDGVCLGDVRLTLVGNHNAMNALAVIAACDAYGVPFEACAQALAGFLGTGRRFDVRADVGGIAVVDDYAHHPTAIKTTLHAARQRYPNRTLWAVWQPHTFSRTLALRDAYLQAFDDAHQVVVTDIFASREAFTDAIHSRELVQAFTHPHAHYGGTLDETTAFLLAHVQAPAVLLIMSAGDAPRIGQAFLQSKAGEA